MGVDIVASKCTVGNLSRANRTSISSAVVIQVLTKMREKHLGFVVVLDGQCFDSDMAFYGCASIFGVVSVLTAQGVKMILDEEGKRS